MAGYKNFQVDRNKFKKGIYDIDKKIKEVSNHIENLSKDEKLREGFKRWTSFFRANPQRFAEMYLQIYLHTFQKILIYLCFHVDFFAYLASRGQGKSFIVAVICCIRCILYPMTKVILSSGTKGQAKLIITQKIVDLANQYPNLKREIKEIKTNANDIKVIFKNGSTIEAVTSTDNARGYRGNVLVIDESRLVPQKIQDTVLRPFLNVNRQPPYLRNPKYKHLQEENKEIYITSAWYKNDYLYEQFKSFVASMCKGKSYFICGLPYTLSMHHGLLSRKRVEQIKTEEGFDSISFLMEYECLFFGESEKAFFKLNEINPCRTMVKPFVPLTTIEYLSAKEKKKKSILPKKEGEIRLIGVDLALMQGSDNDASVFTCMRLLPNGEEYIRQIPYIESLNGSHAERQAIRIRQLFEDFEADQIVMDTNGNGISVYEYLTKVLYDNDRDVEYSAICASNDEKMAERAYDKNAIPIIYSIKAVKQEVNHEMAMGLRSDFQARKIKLLVNEIEGKEYLTDKMGFDKKSPEEQVQMLRAYLQTAGLINELINLEYEVRSGFVKVKEVGKQRKDRYSSLSYVNYYARILEKDLQKSKDESNALDYLFFN